MEFDTSIVGDKVPRDSAALSIALGLESGNALLPSCVTANLPSNKFTDRDLV